MHCVELSIGTQCATGIQGKGCREVSNRTQRAAAHWYGFPCLFCLATAPNLLVAHHLAGEDRKLAVKALASILKGLGLHHEAAAIIAKN